MIVSSQAPGPAHVPLRFDDGFRGWIALAATSVLQAAVLVWIEVAGGGLGENLLILISSVCFTLSVFSIVFVVWTHRIFTGSSGPLAIRVAAEQFRRGPSRASRLLGFGSESTWAMTAAVTALIVAIAAVVIGAAHHTYWLPLLVLLTAGSSWATMVYAFALRYFRLHAGGERFEFLIDEIQGADGVPARDPGFIDFVSMSVMVSSVGALSAGEPRTRAGLAAVRTHTFIAFAFNALVVAMTVSLVTSLIAAGTEL